MKRLILGAILGLSLANANNLNIGVGTGYIDDKYNNVIVKFEQNINSYFNFSGKIGKEDYLQGYFSTLPNFINNKILLSGAIGFEKYKIEQNNETQTFIKYTTWLITKQDLNPKAFIKIGTKSLTAGIGAFINLGKRFSAEYEISKRWLYKKIESKKTTTSIQFFINYSF
jgi:hypothetical protein